MMFNWRRDCLVLVFLACRIPSGAQLIINELMQSNVDCIMDDLNEFPDSWVELCNAGTNEVNLGNYRLGITQNAEEAWLLPDRLIGAGEHVLIYCDKVGSNTEAGIHADFRLDSGKNEYITLFKGDVVEDQIVGLKKQPAPNVAYGRFTDGADEWGYMAEPTPGAPNCGKVYAKAMTEPVFSVEGGVWHEGEEVKLKIRRHRAHGLQYAPSRRKSPFHQKKHRCACQAFLRGLSSVTLYGAFLHLLPQRPPAHAAGHLSGDGSSLSLRRQNRYLCGGKLQRGAV